jgi:hypothetical protein
MGVSKFPQIRFLQFWGRVISRSNLRLRWGLKQSCSACRELSNNMLHVSWTQQNRVDSWLLMVGSQTTNLTPDLSIGHNLCFRCPNRRCEPILDIYVSITFQWYKEFFKAMGFDYYNHVLKIWESIWDSNSYNGSSFRSVRVPSHSLTLFALLRACDVTPGSFSWPATLEPLTSRKPKASFTKKLLPLNETKFF